VDGAVEATNRSNRRFDVDDDKDEEEDEQEQEVDS
jgi:hypothetical protein